MPSHQERREPLPKDYQFPTPQHAPAWCSVWELPCGCYMRGEDHLTLCPQHAREHAYWNVIEGEQH